MTYRAALDLALGGVRQEDETLAVSICRQAKRNGNRMFFIGNGGSAAIASHMAADWLKNGQVAAQCFNDGALVTCIANDDGYPVVFAKPLSMHGKPNDVLFAISSSGKSASITEAVGVAKLNDMQVITLSGFSPENPLRGMGDVNFYVESDRYGVVEVCHHAICHSILDAVMEK